jgi:hypothetical protein
MYIPKQGEIAGFKVIVKVTQKTLKWIAECFYKAILIKDNDPRSDELITRFFVVWSMVAYPFLVWGLIAKLYTPSVGAYLLCILISLPVAGLFAIVILLISLGILKMFTSIQKLWTETKNEILNENVN